MSESQDEKNIARYRAALHAMQSGVLHDMIDPTTAGGTSPINLRVGVNSAMVSDAAVIRLLVEKGIFTLTEFNAVLADEAEMEQARYEKLLSERFGRPVKLG